MGEQIKWVLTSHYPLSTPRLAQHKYPSLTLDHTLITPPPPLFNALPLRSTRNRYRCLAVEPLQLVCLVFH